MIRYAFDHGICETTTPSGKKALIVECESYISIGYYSLYIDGKLVFTRAKLSKIVQTLRTM